MAWTAPRTWANGEVVTSTFLNVNVRDNLSWMFTGDAAWTNLTLGNSWVNYDTAAFGAARYRRNGPWCDVTGLIKNGTFAAVAATLPVGFRPVNIHVITGGGGAGGTTYQELRIHNDGTIVPQTGSNAFFGINVRFLAVN